MNFLRFQINFLGIFLRVPFLSLIGVGWWLNTGVVFAHPDNKSFVDLVKSVKPSVVGVGTYDPIGSPRAQLSGTGFVIGDGSLVATNFHVVERALDEESQQQRVVFVGTGKKPRTTKAEIIATDPAKDLAILKIQVTLKPFTLSNGPLLDDGTEVALTGYPIGSILGLYPATHRGFIATTTPVATPAINSQQLSIEMLKRLKKPFMTYQLDATAYPGSSGSPVYDIYSGDVVAIINRVFVKETKESALTSPTGITYAIPVVYLKQLLSEI